MDSSYSHNRHGYVVVNVFAKRYNGNQSTTNIRTFADV